MAGVDAAICFCILRNHGIVEWRCAIKGRAPTCKTSDHSTVGGLFPPVALERAAQILRAMGDSSRLRILDLLKKRELCVTEIVATVGEKFTTVSQRLKLLRSEGLIVRRREGNHIYYALADRHVVDLILNALAHAKELDADPGNTQQGDD
jgi:ArsR family transcriptional regulator, lead/cadmium/zinc/bismuth-responsive transcriptional repressor